MVYLIEIICLTIAICVNAIAIVLTIRELLLHIRIMRCFESGDDFGGEQDDNGRENGN